MRLQLGASARPPRAARRQLTAAAPALTLATRRRAGRRSLTPPAEASSRICRAAAPPVPARRHSSRGDIHHREPLNDSSLTDGRLRAPTDGKATVSHWGWRSLAPCQCHARIKMTVRGTYRKSIFNSLIAETDTETYNFHYQSEVTNDDDMMMNYIFIRIFVARPVTS